MHKTGTTAIQRAFDGYDDGRIAYADLKILRNRKPNHGVAIETLFRADFENAPPHVKLGRSPATIRQFRRKFAKKLDSQLTRNCDTLIFSGEAIPRLKPEELQALANALRPHCDRIRILAYLRDPVGFSSSMFQQKCKDANLQNLMQIPAPHYKVRFDRFRSVFGSDAVAFARYDPANFPDGSVVADFAQRVGASDVSAVAMANPSLTADATRCLFVLADQGGFDMTDPLSRTTFRKVAAILAAGMPGAAFRLPAAAVSNVVAASDLVWAKEVAGCDFTLSDGRMTETDLRENLSDVSRTGREQLRAILMSRGIHSGPSVTEMMQALFLSVRSEARVALIKGRIKDFIATRVGR